MIDGKKHKILSYKISDIDSGQSIVIKSKIKLCNLEHKVSNISISHDNEYLEIVGKWHFGFSSPGMWSATYLIQKIEYLNSSVT